MTLRDVIDTMKAVALEQPAIHQVIDNDVDRLNSLPNAQYAAFVWTQQQHRGSVNSDEHSFAFSLFYVDRLTEDAGNEVEVQSMGIETLDNILRALAERGIVAADWTYQTFNEKFIDSCAGVFCNVRLSVPVDTVCAVDYTDPII